LIQVVDQLRSGVVYMNGIQLSENVRKKWV